MKYCLNIREYNITELLQEGGLLSNNINLFKDRPKGKKIGDLGYTNFKIINTHGYSYGDMNIMFNENVRISDYVSEPVLSLHFMLNGLIEYKVKNTRSMIANNGRNNIWILNGGHFGYSTYKKNINCSVFGINIKHNFFKELTNKYPDLLSELYNRCIKGETLNLNPQYQFTTIEMINIISQIRRAKLMGYSSQIYTEAKILELLAIQLNYKSDYQKNSSRFHCKSIDDVEKIHEAKKILLADLQQTPSILELSRKVGVNENKLKYGFKEVFNQTVYGCLFDYKMELASMLLLETNKSILEIAYECGYSSASHFNQAFKRKFAINPRAFRHNN